MSRTRRALRWLNARFTPVALVATALGIALALWGQRSAITDADWQVSWTALVPAIGLFAVAPLVQAASFWLILRFLGVPARPGETVVVWMRSFLLRYAPTGALAVAFRVRERGRLAATTPQMLTATAYEQLAALIAGAIACVLAVALAGGRVPVTALAICAAAVAVAVAVRPRFFGEPLRRLAARRGMDVPSVLRGRLLAGVVAVNGAGWLATGAAAWLLVRALVEGDVPDPLWLAGAYAFGWLLGFLVPLLPGGLGLREGTLVAFLAGPFTGGVATALTLALRLASTVGEFVAIGGVEALHRARGARGDRPSTEPPADEARA